MAWTALFAASVLLCLALGQSLVCKECFLDMQGLACLTGLTTCIASPGQPCIAITISQSYGKAYRVYGCKKSLKNRCGFIKDTVRVDCCRDGDLCNARF